MGVQHGGKWVVKLDDGREAAFKAENLGFAKEETGPEPKTEPKRQAR